MVLLKSSTAFLRECCAEGPSSGGGHARGHPLPALLHHALQKGSIASIMGLGLSALLSDSNCVQAVC